jgi:signal transduction histidine kinase
VRHDLIRLHDGLDRAIQHAVHRYTERRDHLRDRFIGFLGHDLRNPLAAVSFAGNALSGSIALGSSERKAVATIAKSVVRMTRMVNDLLDFARGQLAGGIPTTPVECDMGELCEAVADELRVVYPNRNVVVRRAGDLKGTFDPQRIMQCLGNLVGNAIQHGDDPVVVEVTEAEDQRALVTRISNRGQPLPPDLLQRCFDPFASASEGTGLGLGLYIVAEIARAHGGVCDVSSTAEQTAFTIRWPRSPRSETPQRP